MSKSTPINQLPNVEMTTEPVNEMPPPQQLQPMPQPRQMSQTQPLQQIPSMQPLQQIQPLSQHRSIPPMQQSQYIPQTQPHVQQQPLQQVKHLKKSFSVEKSSGIFQELINDSKQLSFVFILLLFVQLESSQGLFRRISRLFNVGDSLLFTISKILGAFVGVIVFFFLTKNL